MSDDRYAPDNLVNSGFRSDPSGNGNARVEGNGGSVTVGQCQDPAHPGQGWISINTGDHKSTYVTDGQGGLIKK